MRPQGCFLKDFCKPFQTTQMNFLGNANGWIANYKEFFAALPLHAGKRWGRTCAAASPCSFVNRASPVTLEQNLHPDVNGKTAAKCRERERGKTVQLDRDVFLPKMLLWLPPTSAVLLRGRALEGQTQPQSWKVMSV